MRARYAISAGQPVVRDLTPEYRVTTGVRRMSEQQAQPLRDAGVQLTEAVIDGNRWYAFWDAPLLMPDAPELRRAAASFSAASCAVSSDDATLAVTFQGLSMGIFSGSLRFTSYRGANLLRMDAIARTSEPWVAYKYEAGLKGLSTDLTPRVEWRDTGGHPQRHDFGGPVNTAILPLKAANRLLIADGVGGSIAVFPPPHTVFFTREVDTNLGYVWYRKDANGRFALGIRQADRE